MQEACRLLTQGFLIDFVVVGDQPHVRPGGWLGLEQESGGRLPAQAIVAQGRRAVRGITARGLWSAFAHSKPNGVTCCCKRHEGNDRPS